MIGEFVAFLGGFVFGGVVTIGFVAVVQEWEKEALEKREIGATHRLHPLIGGNNVQGKK